MLNFVGGVKQELKGQINLIFPGNSSFFFAACYVGAGRARYISLLEKRKPLINPGGGLFDP